MPMYEYRCEECGAKYEQLRRMSEADTNLECPACGSLNVRREVSACAIGGSASSSNSGGGCVPRGGFS
ncbi:MAG: zinc ribbon domain-containing protein [Bryobacteraceae bacterium]|nr:MAG: zinc ribbon domain-containing protein [Bryobacteraceae bacterium]